MNTVDETHFSGFINLFIYYFSESWSGAWKSFSQLGQEGGFRETCGMPVELSRGQITVPDRNVAGALQMSLDLQQPSGASNGPGAFQCPNCGKFYKYRRNMLSHFKLECGMEPQFCCQFCPRRYKQKSKLQIHVGSKHSNEFSAIWGDSSGKQEKVYALKEYFVVCARMFISQSVRQAMTLFMT